MCFQYVLLVLNSNLYHNIVCIVVSSSLHLCRLPVLSRLQRGAKEEDPHRVQPQPGVPAGVHLRPEALPERLGAGRAGRLAAAHRDPGEDLVSKPQEQVEEAGRCGQRVVRVHALYRENITARTPPAVVFSNAIKYPVTSHFTHPVLFMTSQMTGLV